MSTARRKDRLVCRESVIFCKYNYVHNRNLRKQRMTVVSLDIFLFTRWA